MSLPLEDRFCLTDGVHSVTTGRQLAALRSTIGPGQDELVAALPE